MPVRPDGATFRGATHQSNRAARWHGRQQMGQ